jgi:hypothetical protein
MFNPCKLSLLEPDGPRTGLENNAADLRGLAARRPFAGLCTRSGPGSPVKVGPPGRSSAGSIAAIVHALPPDGRLIVELSAVKKVRARELRLLRLAKPTVSGSILDEDSCFNIVVSQISVPHLYGD